MLGCFFYWLGVGVFTLNVLLLIAFACSAVNTLRQPPKRPFLNSSHRVFHTVFFAIANPLMRVSKSRELEKYKELIASTFETAFRSKSKTPLVTKKDELKLDAETSNAKRRRMVAPT